MESKDQIDDGSADQDKAIAIRTEPVAIATNSDAIANPNADPDQKMSKK